MDPILGIRKEFVEHISSPYDNGPLAKLMGEKNLIKKLKQMRTQSIIVISDYHQRNHETPISMTFQEGEAYPDKDCLLMNKQGHIPVTGYDSIYDVILLEELEEPASKFITLNNLSVYGFRPQGNIGVDWSSVIHVDPVLAFHSIGKERGRYDGVNRSKNTLGSIHKLKLGHQNFTDTDYNEGDD